MVSVVEDRVLGVVVVYCVGVGVGVVAEADGRHKVLKRISRRGIIMFRNGFCDCRGCVYYNYFQP